MITEYDMRADWSGETEPDPEEVTYPDLTHTLPVPPLGSTDLYPHPAPRYTERITAAVCAKCGEPARYVYEVHRYNPVKQSGGGHLARYVGACTDDTHRRSARSAAYIYGGFSDPTESDIDTPETLW